jgi:hypothetical protein
MSNVVGLRGQAVVDHRVAREEVVAECRDLLERAEAGEIIGVAGVMLYSDESTGYIDAGVATYSMVGRLHGAITQLLERLK